MFVLNNLSLVPIPQPGMPLNYVAIFFMCNYKTLPSERLFTRVKELERDGIHEKQKDGRFGMGNMIHVRRIRTCVNCSSFAYHGDWKKSRKKTIVTPLWDRTW